MTSTRIMMPVIPKLKKNRRIETRWSPQYYTALKDAVFSQKSNPYICRELPKELLGENEEPPKTHDCASCCDRFYFQSSYDDHFTRKTWILGYWCNNCFQVNCKHVTDPDFICEQCQITDQGKLNYMRKRGLKKGQKPGKTLIFYNRCQLLEHLKLHDIYNVELTDIMLLPLPAEIQPHEYNQLHLVSEALLEYMFIKRVHVMDWLRLKKIDFKWWLTDKDDKNPVGSLLQLYDPNSIGESAMSVLTSTALDEHQQPINEDDTVNEGKTIDENNDGQSEESEDDVQPCAAEVESPVEINQTEPPPVKTYQNKKVIVNPIKVVSINNPISKEINGDQNTAPKFSNVKICSTNGQISLDSIKNKKFIIISQTTNKPTLPGSKLIKVDKQKFFTAVTGQVESTKSTVPVPKVMTVRKPTTILPKGSVLKTSDGHVLLQNGSKIVLRQIQKRPTGIFKVNSDNTLVPITSSGTMNLSSKIVPIINKNTVKSSKPEIIPKSTEELKVLIEYFKKPPINILGSSNIPNSKLNNPGFLRYWRDTSILKKVLNATYNASRGNSPEFLSIRFVGNNELYLQRKFGNVTDKNVNNNRMKIYSEDQQKIMVQLYRENLITELQRSGKPRAELIIDHLKDVTVKYFNANCVNQTSVLTENLQTMKNLEKYLNIKVTAIDSAKNDDVKLNNDYDNERREWEKKYQASAVIEKCRKCDLDLKPKYYIPGISKPAADESKYCQCYNYICHICNARQGSLRRYKAHLKYHKKELSFECPECFQSFPTMHQLEIHVWTRCFHIGTQQFFACKICNITGFLTLEDVTRHFLHIHAESAVLCGECDRILGSYADYHKHYQNEHTYPMPFPQPEQLIICGTGHCLVRPENYRAHVQTHFEIEKITYFICPFCSFFVKEKGPNRQLIQDHVFTHHSQRLREVMTRDTLQYFTTKFHLPVPASHRFVPIAPAGNTTTAISTATIASTNDLPKILNACSISSKDFDREYTASGDIIDNCSISPNEFERTYSPAGKILNACSISSKEFERTGQFTSARKIVPIEEMENILKQTLVPKIISVGSEIVKVKIENTSDEVKCEKSTEMCLPKIVDVTSMNKNVFVPEDKKPPKRIVMFSPQKATNGDLTIQDADGQIRTFPSIVATKINTKNSRKCDVMTKFEISEREISIVKVPSDKKSSSSLVIERNDDDIEPSDDPINSSHDDFIIGNNLLSQRNPELTIEEVRINKTQHSRSRKQIFKSSPNRSRSLSSSNKTIDTDEELSKTTMENIQLSLKTKRRRRRPWRIALNGPNCNSAPINYKCHLCDERISTSWQVIKSHFEARHSKDYKVSILSPKVTRLPETSCSIESKENGRKRKLGITSPVMKKRGRWGMKKLSDKSQSPSLGICIRQESLQDTEGNFKCRKCDELFENVHILREHVAANHRIRGHFLVCLECGENFIVAPSLQMHLKAFHGIMDPIKYMAQNTAYAPDAMDDFEAQEKITESNQCHVCKAVFVDKAAVDKHLRVHGMAYLNRRRIEARNALKSPEKRGQVSVGVNKNDEETEKHDDSMNNHDALEDTENANDNQL